MNFEVGDLSRFYSRLLSISLPATHRRTPRDGKHVTRFDGICNLNGASKLFRDE